MKKENGTLQVLHARLLPDHLRETGYWAVLVNHPSDVIQTVEAAYELMSLYLSRRDYARALGLANEVKSRDRESQKMIGSVLQAIVESRMGLARESIATLKAAYEDREEEEVRLPVDQLEWLGGRYAFAVRRNAELAGERFDYELDEFAALQASKPIPALTDTQEIRWPDFMIESGIRTTPIHGAIRRQAQLGMTNGVRYSRVNIALASLSPPKVLVFGSNASLRPRR